MASEFATTSSTDKQTQSFSGGLRSLLCAGSAICLALALAVALGLWLFVLLMVT